MSDIQKIKIGEQEYTLKDGSAVAFDEAQALTEEQKQQARANIGAAAEGESAAMQTLTFTGAVSATYDGSTAVSVEIPTSGWETCLKSTSVNANSYVAISASVATRFNAFYIALCVPSTSSVYTTIVPTSMLNGMMYIVLPDGYKLAITKLTGGQLNIANAATSTVYLYVYGLV